MEVIKEYLFNFVRSCWSVLAIIAAILTFNTFFFIYQVNGSSMNPTLTDGDLGIATRLFVSHLDRGDIVVVDNGNRLLIKRLIGEPNDHVQCKDGTILVNGQAIDESYTQGITDDFDIALGNDEYFVLGDNREHSSDSRTYGAFAKHDIMGVIIEEM